MSTTPLHESQSEADQSRDQLFEESLEALHELVKAMGVVTERVEQMTAHIPETRDLSLLASRVADIRVRARNLRNR